MKKPDESVLRYEATIREYLNSSTEQVAFLQNVQIPRIRKALKLIRHRRIGRWTNVKHVKLRPGQIYVIRRMYGRKPGDIAVAEWTTLLRWKYLYNTINSAFGTNTTIAVMVRGKRS